MIQFKNLNQGTPYSIFIEKYNEALNSSQKSIEAVSISSYNTNTNEISSRYVNLKFIINDEFIFFTNYNSPKASDFNSHSQIAALFYWSSINVQIRIKGKIKKISNIFNQEYFSKRDLKKNALAISSYQSESINSYRDVKDNYKKSLKNDSLSICPEYWGGFSFVPYYFEFWEGHESRINRREVFNKINDNWEHSFLQP